MTYAPTRLLEVRAVVQPIVMLPNAALGIAPDAAHVGGYHCGWDDRRVAGDYSWSESTRDSSHKTNAARAFDLGWFDIQLGGRRVTLIDFNLWFVNELKANAADTRDVREFIYTPDGRTVLRWDRLGKRSSGDSSHKGHSHTSWFADAETRDKSGPFRRFFAKIGDDMSDAYNLLDSLTRTQGSATFTPDGPDGVRYGSLSNAAAIASIQRAAKDARLAADGVAEVKTRLDRITAPELTPEQLAAIAAQAGEHAAALIGGKLDALLAEVRKANEAERAGLQAELGKLAGQ